MTPEDQGQGTMMEWLRRDIKDIFKRLDQLTERVTELSASFSRYAQPCNDFKAHLAEHERRESRWWGLVLAVAGKLITAAVAAGLALAASGKWPKM